MSNFDDLVEENKSSPFERILGKRKDLLMYYQIGASALLGARNAYRWYKNRSTYYMSISSNAYSQYVKLSAAYKQFELGKSKTREFAVNERGTLTLDDAWIKAKFRGLEFELNHSTTPRGGMDTGMISTFSFRFQSELDMVNFLKFLEDFETRDSRPYILDPDDMHYGSGKRYISRTWDSVIVPDEVKENLSEDIESLHRNAERYENLGLPVRRGYIFEGEPGNGKSSMIQGIANQYGYNIFMLDLNKYKNNDEFVTALTHVPNQTIIVIEDIDNYPAVKRDAETTDGVNLSGLLNVLDGITSPNDVLFIITTNHAESLDPAIVRPGRCDRHIYFGNPSQKEIDKAFLTFFEESLDADVETGYSMATYTEIMRRHVDDANAARAELKELKPVQPTV